MTTATKSSDLLPPVFAIGANGFREAGRPVRGGEIRPDSLMQLDRVQKLQISSSEYRFRAMPIPHSS